MTNEEKAKRYDEAIKKLRDLHDNYDEISNLVNFKQEIEEIFPELRESEDERIIEEIKFAVMQMPSSRQDTKNRCLAYLEKQKINTDGDFGRGYDCGYEACLHSNGAEWLEKQKEQKPAEKQDYSGLNDLERAILRGFLSAGVENVPVGIIKETAQECLAQRKPAEWIEDYWQHHKVVNPDSYNKSYEIQFDHDGFVRFCKRFVDYTEWDDDDKRILDSVIWHVRNSANNGNLDYSAGILENWLKSLRPQPKQEWSEDIIRKAVKEVGLTQHQIDWFKTNVFSPKQEWSKEDDKRVKQLIYDTEYIRAEYEEMEEELGERFNSVLIKDCDEQITWLKNLQERFNLQPKQKWSKEDEKMLAKIIERGQSQIQMFETGLLPEHIDWLKSLRHQQKSEWSKEDKEMLGKVLECIRFAEDRYQLEDERMNGVAVKSWLLDNINPQPHWKPSEEQMWALKCAVEDIAKFSKRGGRQVEFENEPYYMALHSLYCNLEKLM